MGVFRDTPDASRDTHGLGELISEWRDGRLRLASFGPGHVEFADVKVRVTARRRSYAAALRPADDAFTALWPQLGLRAELRLQHEARGMLLRLVLENCGNTVVALEEVAPLCVMSPARVTIGVGIDRWSVFRNGYQSWSGTRAYQLDQVDADPWGKVLRMMHVDVRHPAAGRAGVVRSELFTVIKNLRSGEAVGMGFFGAQGAFCGVFLDTRGRRFRELTASVDYDGVDLRPGERIVVPPLWIAAGFDGHHLLTAYTTALGAAMGARVGERSPVGWCSWYYYFTKVSEAGVLSSVETLAASRERLRCDYVMIDDGYQRAIGDWLECNEKFPRGMQWLSERIRAEGFDAGIWLAPFIARREARLFQQRPDWFVRTARGRLRTAVWNPAWGLWGFAYALDTTHPEVLDWLAELAHTIVHHWGYRVLKLDFLFAAALPGVRHDRSANRAQALRRGLEAIRAGAGEDAFLLGCGCPLGPAIGVVDGMRIGPDVAPFWSNWLSRGPLRDRHGVATKHAVRNALTRAFMHRRLWLNDPDCLMVRDSRTRLTLEETRTLAAAIALTDGMFVVGDRLDALSSDRRNLLEQVYRMRGGMAQAVDLFRCDLPELLVSDRDGELLIGVFNFGDRPQGKAIKVGQFGVPDGSVTEIWSERDLLVRNGWVQIDTIPPHGNRIVRCASGKSEAGGSACP